MKVDGKKMRRTRQLRGITLTQMALAMGISKQSLSYWELGVRTPQVDNLKRVSNFLGISMGELIIEDESNVS
jgi:transcriptional regulator with XRE-family HTH domain